MESPLKTTRHAALAIATIATLVTLALGTVLCTCGVLPWTELLRDDSPLPHALASVLSPGHPMTHLMVYLGLLGLVASFHGIVDRKSVV